MSTSLQVQNHPLVTTAVGVLAKRITTPDNDQAVELARRSIGRIIQGDADAAVVADEAEALRLAEKRITEAKAEVLEIPKAMTKAVGDACANMLTTIKAGREALRTAGTNHLMRKEDERLAALREQQREAERLAKQQRDEQARAQAAAVEVGLPAPEAEVVVPLVAAADAPKQTVTRGGSGSQVLSTVLKCELVNVHECDPAWLELRGADARSWFLNAVKREELADAAIGRQSAVIHKGVAFFREAGVTQRSR